MALTSDQIAEIVSGLSTSQTDAALEKRRRAVRIKHRDTVTIIPYADNVPRANATATLADFSSRGVALQFPYNMPSGSHFVLMLPRDGYPPLRLLCEVAHARLTKHGYYAIGAQFVGFAPTTANTDTPAAQNAEAARIASSIFG